MTFCDHHAIITGGSSGIGKATAKLLANKGAHISIIARTQATLDAAKAEIEAVKLYSHQKIMTVSCDVSNRFQAEQAIEAAINEIGLPDFLITSAGIAHPGYFQEIPINIFEETMAINYFGSLYCIRAVLPAMKKQRKGHIFLISSGAGLIGIYGYTSYSPTKFALRGLAESLRGELKRLGINVSIIYPPDTDTPQLEYENKTKPIETKAITSRAGLWSAEKVAHEIVKGIENKNFIITPGLELTLLSWLHSVMRPLLNWYGDRIVNQVHSSLLKLNEKNINNLDDFEA